MKYDFGLRLREYREVAGLDYAQLSQALRERGYVITPRRIKRIEEGNSQPNTKDLLAFARCVHIRIAELLGVKMDHRSYTLWRPRRSRPETCHKVQAAGRLPVVRTARGGIQREGAAVPPPLVVSRGYPEEGNRNPPSGVF